MPDGLSPVQSPLHNEESEHGLLGALLADNAQVGKVAEILKGEHFYDPLHGEIYTAIVTTVSEGAPANPVTLRNLFLGHPADSTTPGGVAGYIVKLTGAFVHASEAPHYARLIADLAHRRMLEALADELRRDARTFAPGRTVADVLERHEAALAAVDDYAADAKVKPLVSIRQATEKAIHAAERATRSGGISGITTGLHSLDRRTGGLQRGQLIILGARPSMGKSDLGWNIAVNAAAALRAGKECGAAPLYFSQEMPDWMLGARTLARSTGIAADRQMRGEVDQRDFTSMVQAIPDLPLWVDDAAGITPAVIRRRARRQRQKGQLGLIVVDHLHIMGEPEEVRGQGQTAKITELTRQLKAIATGFDVPVLLLCQLNRSVELREDKRPVLSDLRDSGSIEQDADVVMFLYRDEYYQERAEPTRRQDESDEKFNDRYQRWEERREASRNIAEVNIAKQRMGQIGPVTLFYSGAESAFSDLERHQ